MKIPNTEREDLLFELPLKKNNEGLYRYIPKTNHIGGKNALRTLQSKKTKIGYVYFLKIKDTNKYKIGVSEKPHRRLADISSSMPFDIELLAINQINNPYNFEQELINEFEIYLIKNEWFEFNLNQAKYIMVLLHNKQVKESIYG